MILTFEKCLDSHTFKRILANIIKHIFPKMYILEQVIKQQYPNIKDFFYATFFSNCVIYFLNYINF